MEKQFPRTMVGGKSLSRMIIGTNWMAGWSHTGAAADAMIKERHSTPDTLIPMFEKFLEYGVDTVMAPFSSAPVVLRAVKETEQKVGKKIIMVDTPSINIEDSAKGRQEAMAKIRESRESRFNSASYDSVGISSASYIGWYPTYRYRRGKRAYRGASSLCGKSQKYGRYRYYLCKMSRSYWLRSERCGKQSTCTSCMDETSSL